MPPWADTVPVIHLQTTQRTALVSVVSWQDLKRHRQLIVATRNDSKEKSRLRVDADVWWVESQWIIIELVQRNLGWVLVPEHIVVDALKEGSLVSPTLDFDKHGWPVAVELVWHKEKPLGKAGLGYSRPSSP